MTTYLHCCPAAGHRCCQAPRRASAVTGTIWWRDTGGTGKKHPPPPPPLETGWVQCETSGASSSSTAVPSRARGSASSTWTARTAAALGDAGPRLPEVAACLRRVPRHVGARRTDSTLAGEQLPGGGWGQPSRLHEPEAIGSTEVCVHSSVVAVSYLFVYSVKRCTLLKKQ